MGVMYCSRNGCSNCMCDTHISSIGYICYPCKEEFKKYVEEKKINLTTEMEIRENLEVFMSISKDAKFDEKEITIDQFFNQNTK